MIKLFQFQEVAAASVASKVSDYLDGPVQISARNTVHTVPFFHAISAVTGAGKTVILAEAVSQIADTMPVKPVIMWLSKGRVVVAQSYANLAPGGKYHHLLDNLSVQLLSDYSPEDVAESDRGLVYFATVGTFNQRDKEDGNLRIHKSDVDVMEASIWEAIQMRLDASGNRRPLVIVYDEAQNLSDQQTQLLLELEPDGFLVASATMRVPARLGTEINHLKTSGFEDKDLTTRVKTSDVVGKALVKDTVLLEGYNAPMEETVTQLLGDMEKASADAAQMGLGITPKAIYVCNTNVVADTPNLVDNPKRPFAERQAPPIQIWRFLVEQMGVDPRKVAVYSDLKTDMEYPLPEEFVLFKGGDKDYDNFINGDYQHIIFNLTLQEGWDDPSVYFAYIDKSMGSSAQVTQVIGRVLRQPGTIHYPVERLNAAHFYVRVDKNAIFNDVINEVKKELGEGPDGVRVVVSAPGKTKPKDLPPKYDRYVPETALDAGRAQAAVAGLLHDFPDFRKDETNTKGEGSRRVLRQKVGNEANESQWESFEQASQASARWIFTREVQRQFKSALGVVNLADPKLNAVVGIGSPAYRQICNFAESVVSAYVKSVRLKQRRSNPYRVGTLLGDPDDMETFDHAVHEGYSGLNLPEKRFAYALDDTKFTWCRNPPRSGYGIPLVTVGPTDFFFPDFLVWTSERVVCIDTKGHHLIRETAARKLLHVRNDGDGPRLDIQFVSEGKYDDGLDLRDTEGFTYWGISSDGSIRSVHFDEISGLLKHLLDDALHDE